MKAHCARKATNGNGMWNGIRKVSWFGDVNAGMQCLFRAENYRRPLNTNFYKMQPLNMPPSWFNDGKGRSAIKRKETR